MGFRDGVSPSRQRILRLVTVSRVAGPLSPLQLAHLAAVAGHDAPEMRLALVSVKGGHLLWAEGGAAALCASMPELARASWLEGARLAAIGWSDMPRFGSSPVKPVDCTQALSLPPEPAGAEAELGVAIRAFDALAMAENARLPAALLGQLSDFVINLCDGVASVALPGAVARDLRARAAFVDICLCRIGDMQAAGRIGSAEVTLALTLLNGLLQRAGRVPQPIAPRGRVALVLPPEETELIGAMVKADLLRAAGVAVEPLIDLPPSGILEVLRAEPAAIPIVLGPRVAPDLPGGRADQLAERLRQSFPGRPIWRGGRSSGPLCETVERVRLIRHRVHGMALAHVNWGGIGSLAQLMEIGPESGCDALSG